MPTGVVTFVRPGFALTPAWSPTGSDLAYVLGQSIHALRVADGRDTTLVPTESFFPTWSPSGDTLAYDSPENDPRGGSVIWTLALSTGVRTDISVHGTGEWRNPDWGRISNRLVHIRYLAGTSGAEIFTMSSNGAASVRLTTNGLDDREPTWSPDNSEIAWTIAGTAPEIWIMNADGTAKRRLTSGQQPSWFPSGDSLVFVDASSGSAQQLHVISRNGGGRRPLILRP